MHVCVCAVLLGGGDAECCPHHSVPRMPMQGPPGCAEVSLLLLDLMGPSLGCRASEHSKYVQLKQKHLLLVRSKETKR